MLGIKANRTAANAGLVRKVAMAVVVVAETSRGE
jgi:hypothetical protein